MKVVDEHVMQIVERLANEDKSAREVYGYLHMAFGDPNEKGEK